MNQKSIQLKMNEQINEKKEKLFTLQCQMMDLSGGMVDKNPAATAGDMRSIPGPGRFHMPGSN